jgi:hypothetical protein
LYEINEPAGSDFRTTILRLAVEKSLAPLYYTGWFAGGQREPLRLTVSLRVRSLRASIIAAPAPAPAIPAFVPSP